MTLHDAELALGVWASANGYQPVVEYDGGPQPPYPYIGIYLQSVSSASNQPEIIPQDDGTLLYREQITIGVKLNAYSIAKSNAGDNASSTQMLEKMLLETASIARQTAFRAAGMAFLRRGSAHRMPFYAADTWVDRAVVECWFSSVRIYVEPLSAGGIAIEKVRVDPQAPLSDPPFDVVSS